MYIYIYIYVYLKLMLKINKDIFLNMIFLCKCLISCFFVIQKLSLKLFCKSLFCRFFNQLNKYAKCISFLGIFDRNPIGSRNIWTV